MAFQHVEPTSGSPTPMLGRVSWPTLATMVFAFLPLFAPARAKADLTLGQAGQYTIFGNTVDLNGPPTVTGTVAVANGGSLSVSGGEFMGTVVFGSSAVLTNNSNPVQHSSSQDLTAASNAIATAAIEAATAVNNSTPLTGTSGSHNGQPTLSFTAGVPASTSSKSTATSQVPSL